MAIINGTDRKLNYRFARKDPRDFKYSSLHATALDAALPKKIDLSPEMPPVYDQGSEGSCTAHALTAHKEFLDMKYVPHVFMSRQFLYYVERAMEGDPGDDAGANLRDGCDALLKVGICEEKLWPYEGSNLYHAPTKDCYDKAKAHKIGSYYQVDSPYMMKKCLASGFPFVFGINCPNQIQEDQVATTGVLPNCKDSDATGDGHALLCVGYDNDKKTYLIRNSWGADWGNKGYFTIPQYMMESSFWVSDCYTIRLAKQPPLK